MDLREAIFSRRAVRAYTPQKVDRETVLDLIRCAVQAPSAMNAQPWAFVVVEGVSRLRHYSERSKAHLLENLSTGDPLNDLRSVLLDPEMNIFYDAEMLVIICAKDHGSQAAEDCCLAAQNLMLMAHALGLGTCPIGLARPWLNKEGVKQELGIPANYAPVFPLIVGHPSASPPAIDRHEPKIIHLS
jgi:nitroreductase